MKSNEPICNDCSTERAKAAFQDFAQALDDQIGDLTRQLHALIQVKYTLDRLYKGGNSEDLKGQLDVVNIAMREAARGETLQGEVIKPDGTTG